MLYVEYFRVLYSRYCQELEVFCIGTASTASTELLPIWAVYSEYEVYVDHLCTVSIIPSPFYCRIGLNEWGVGASYFRGGGRGATGVLSVPSVFREYILRVLAVITGLICRILSSIASISVVFTAGTPCTQGAVLLILSVILAVFGPSVLLILPLCSQYLGR